MTALTDPFYAKGYQAYKLYLALDLHFRSEKYDYFQYDGAVRATEEAFLKRNDRYWFAKFAKNKTLAEMEELLVCSIMVNGRTWIGNLSEEQLWENHRKWLKYFEAFAYNFSQDLETMYEGETNFGNILRPANNSVPKIVKLVLQQEIKIESLIAIDWLTDFMLEVDNIIDDPYVWERFKKKYDKYYPFALKKLLQVTDEEKAKSVIRKTLAFQRK